MIMQSRGKCCPHCGSSSLKGVAGENPLLGVAGGAGGGTGGSVSSINQWIYCAVCGWEGGSGNHGMMSISG